MLDSERPLRLTTDPSPDLSPAWSPDDRHIAFVRYLGGGRSGVFLTTPLGPPERKLVEARLPVSGRPRNSLLAWHPSGKYLVVARWDEPGEPGGLFLMSIGERSLRRLTSGADLGPAFSPDGRSLVFARQTGLWTRDLYMLVLSDDLAPEGEPRRLTSENQIVGGPVWTPDGREILFSLGGIANPLLWRIAASGAESPRRLASAGENGIMPALSGQGNRLAYVQIRYNTDIWRVAMSGLGRAAGPPVRHIHSTRWDGSAQYSPDGRKVAFRSDRSGNSEIWICDGDGSNAVQLTSFGGPNVGGPAWSPDGESVAFVLRREGPGKICIVSAGGGKPRQLTENPGSDENPS
jgi:Tol biopolymer transport system component